MNVESEYWALKVQLESKLKPLLAFGLSNKEQRVKVSEVLLDHSFDWYRFDKQVIRFNSHFSPIFSPLLPD